MNELPMNYEDRCGGTLIVHERGHRECTDPECFALHLIRHDWVLDCASAGCDCGSITALAAS